MGLDNMLASLDNMPLRTLDSIPQHSLHPSCLAVTQQLPWSPSTACSLLEPSLDCQQLHRWADSHAAGAAVQSSPLLALLC